MSEPKKLTNDFLKGKMVDAMVFRGNAKDVNTITKAGFYIFSTGATNLPEGVPVWGTMGVMTFVSFIFQMFVSADCSYILVRYGAISNLPNISWMRIQTSALT